MRCKDISAQLADYLAGSLGEGERNALESHLRSCPACQDELGRASQMWQLLGAIPGDAPDSRTMRARFDSVLAEAVRDQASVSTATRSSRGRIGEWLRRYAPAQPLLQGCAVLLVLLVGIQLGRGIRPPPSPEVQELSQEVRDLRQMVTLSLMQQQSASERLKGVSWSNQLDRPGNEVVTALIDTLMHDSNVNVRLASIDALKRFADRGAVRDAAVHALGTQRSPLVQMALIDFVVETREHSALDTLRKLAMDSTVNEAVRARAAWGVDHLGSAA
jgi:anti-sigma factor RsiW